MDKRWIVTRNGREFVLYAGLLDDAHHKGLTSILTQLLQTPSDANGQTAIVQATATTAAGTYQGIGDANPDNVPPFVRPHLIRMAETRAKARALRDAVNIAAAALEELAEEVLPCTPSPTSTSSRPPASPPSPSTRPNAAPPGRVSAGAPARPAATPPPARSLTSSPKQRPPSDDGAPPPSYAG